MRKRSAIPETRHGLRKLAGLTLMALLSAVCQAETSTMAERLQQAASDGLYEPGLISDGGVFCLTLSPAEDRALWVRSGGGRSSLAIMEAKRRDGRWLAPFPASFSMDPRWKDIDPMFSPDGRSLIFQSNRPVPNRPERSGFDIWQVRLQAEGWGEPEHLGDGINGDDSESSASMAADGSIYFMKNNPDGEGQSDLYVSRFKDGRYQAPENLGAPINTRQRESNPFIAPDQSYLIYFSSGPDVQGETDLLISFREGGHWRPPINLGPPINSVGAEFCPMVHRDRLYLSRQFKAEGRLIENIHRFPIDLQRLRERDRERKASVPAGPVTRPAFAAPPGTTPTPAPTENALGRRP
ncbi:TolB family protein [Kinneretia aquatilis]|uniref:TolB family protein n=1 Tax=Kinneretia aquatilis TaxID=2070761 RepID=UPI001495078A|nr:PD40 domain-containing protein [Paucibacter aquatile]WIV98363.1 PD40 domain-containing protein [Paucibacter aquatile]